MVYVIVFWCEFTGQMRAARSVAGQRLGCWPTLKKKLYKEDTGSPLFKNTDILHTGSEIKHEIICMSRPYSTKQQIIDMPK